MQFLRVGLCAAWMGAAAVGAWAQAPEDRYLRAYALIEQADHLKNSGQARAALTRYREAQEALKELRQSSPGWNDRVVGFREEYIASQLAALAATLPPEAPAAPGTAATRPVAAGATGAKTPALTGADAATAPALAALQAENARQAEQISLLEAKLREALKVQPAAADPRELAKLQERLAALQKDRDLLALSLEQAKAQRPAAAPAPEAAPSVAAVAPSAPRTSAPVANDSLLAQEMEKLRVRLMVLEVQAVPYTPEELALFRQAPPKVAAEQVAAAPAPAPAVAPTATPSPSPVAAGAATTNGTAVARRKTELPAGAGPLLRDAERAIDAGRFDEAERKLRDILRQDENLPFVLAKLAAVQMDQDKPADAEVSLKKALAVDPQDAACLYLLGSLRVRQEKFDDAIDLLGQAVKIVPDNAQAHFFLGKALVQKGQRKAAEAELRRAIQLKPGWGEAHYVMAVMYATEEPTFKGLAQYHYKRAIAGGAPRNPELERWMEKSGGGSGGAGGLKAPALK